MSSGGPSSLPSGHAGSLTASESPEAIQSGIDAGPVGGTPKRWLTQDWQQTLTILLTFLAALALLWLLWQIVTPVLRTLLLFALSGVLAFILAQPVNAVAARIGHRTAAIVAVFLLLGLVVIGGLALLAGPFIGQASALAVDLPRYARELETWASDIERGLAPYGVNASLEGLKARIAISLEEGGGDILGHLVVALADIGGLLVDILLALVISFYLLLDGPRIRRKVLAAVPERHQSKALFLEGQTVRVLGGYLRGQLILALTIGIVAGGGCALIGVPYAVVIGVLAALFELVPMFGPILSAVPALLVALFQPFPMVLWVLLFFVVIQQIENNVLVPRISGHAVGLHPLGALFALLAGFQLAGILGALFAVPIAGVFWVLFAAGYRNAMSPPRRSWVLPSWRQRPKASQPPLADGPR